MSIKIKFSQTRDINVKFASNANPLILKNQRPSGSAGNLKNLADVDMTGAVNNGVVTYDTGTQKFTVNDLDGGEY